MCRKCSPKAISTDDQLRGLSRHQSRTKDSIAIVYCDDDTMILLQPIVDKIKVNDDGQWQGMAEKKIVDMDHNLEEQRGREQWVMMN